MTKDNAIAAATVDAKKYDCSLAIVNDPYSDEETPFGFCPLNAVRTLFPYGQTVGIVKKDGTFIAA